MKKIFVMIPSLFDISIQKTVEDCLLKAKYPDRITFALSLQGVEGCNFDNIKNEKRIILLDKNIVYGIGKTRYQLQKLYNGEEYVLSIDCHTSFDDEWDEKLISEYEEIGNQKAVISQFLLDRFSSDFKKSRYVFKKENPWAIDYVGHDQLSRIKQRSLSYNVAPHFIFASKEFMTIDYPYMYLWGDEDPLLSIKLFCNGFDVYELEKTYMTTDAKNKKDLNNRKDWLYGPMYKSNDNFDIYFDSQNEVPKDSKPIKYFDGTTYMSDHLFYPDTKIFIKKMKEAAFLLENNFNDILKEDFRNKERSIKEYFESNGISWDQVLSSIDRSKQLDV